MDRDALLQALGDALRAQPEGLAAGYVFGSVGRGTHTAASDVDLGLLFATPPSPTLDAQPYALEAMLGDLVARRVQIVVMDTAPIDLVHRILADGVLIFEADRSRRVAFEVRARNLYWDLLPILKEYRRPKVPA